MSDKTEKQAISDYEIVKKLYFDTVKEAIVLVKNYCKNMDDCGNCFIKSTCAGSIYRKSRHNHNPEDWEIDE